jgi:hypothetical protein
MKVNSTTQPWFARHRKFVIFGGVGLLAVALCIGAAVLHSRAERRRARAEIQKRLDVIRAAGEPVTKEDMAKLYPDPPPERDAALLLAPAVAAVREPDSMMDLPYFDSTVELPPKSQPLTDEMRTNMEALVKVNQAALNAIPWDKITNAWIGSGFARGFDNGLDSRFYRHFHWLWKTLCLKAILEGESGNGTQAVESLRQELALFHIFRSETILDHLISRTGENRFCDALERILNRTQIPDAGLADAERLLSDDRPDGLHEAFMSLRCLNIFSMTMIQSTPNSAWAVSNASQSALSVAVEAQIFGIYGRLSGKIYSDADFTEMLDARAAQIAALKLPPKERFAEFTRTYALAATNGRPLSYAECSFGAAHDWSAQLRTDAEALAKLRVTRAALEIERWRLAHGGRAPDSLADLTPDFAPSVPLDPFDNNPLRYKKLPRGFMVYSIGADFTDDGGREKTGGDDDKDNYDIMFSIER